jgi:hypothetical protein
VAKTTTRSNAQGNRVKLIWKFDLLDDLIRHTSLYIERF